jgi:hypothetical protein
MLTKDSSDKEISMDLPYIPGSNPPPEIPLSRFIPPIPGGMGTAWCQKFLSPGDWVLEPFGYNPMLIIEIAAAGYPVLTTINNPIHAFILQMIASAPGKDELIAALQDLAITPKGNDRMEPYIRSLYHVTCKDCKREIEADAFLWEKGSEKPYAVQVKCPYCGAAGDQAFTEEDHERLRGLPPVQLHQARALNRIIGADSTLRSQVVNALNAYPARPLIVLQTIINKLDSLEQSPRHRDLLIGLILSAADQGNTLWAYPSPRNRPRQIVVPNVYQERNLWKVLEESITSWQVIDTPIPVKTWGDMAAEPFGIHVFHGRIRELAPQPDQDFFSAVLATIPRPNQAFWTLSALWTGWIWGQHAVAPIRNVLSRQRYDWNWHTNALKGVFDAIQTYHHPGLKMWGIAAENEPMLLLASLMAAETSGLTLSAFSHSLDDQVAQCYWVKTPNPSVRTKPNIAITIAKQKVKDFLITKGEPSNYQEIHTAAITGLANENKLTVDIFLQNPNSATSETQKWIETIFTEEALLRRVGGGTATLETGEWWLRDPSNIALPLIDRVEEKLLKLLFTNEITSAQEVKTHIYQAFEGIYTPENKVLLNCLESYADLIDPEKLIWKIRDNEKQAIRKAEVDSIRGMLVKIGKRLNFKPVGIEPLLWMDQGQNEPEYSFHVFSTALIAKHIRQDKSQARTKVLVFPGSRSNLLAFKKQRDPVLAQVLEHEYLAVKFRLIRDLEANPLLTRDLFIEQIQVDPPEYRSSQLALF